MKKDIDTFKITMMYNYYKEDYKTNKFVECFIDVESEKLNKSKRIYEGWWIWENINITIVFL